MVEPTIEFDLKELKAIQSEMNRIAKELSGDPMKAAMAKATLLVTGDARRNAPVDRGALRASIVPEVVTSAANEVQGIVGSTLKYAPYQEFGTRPFWAPIGPLYEWARRVLQTDEGAYAMAKGVQLAIATQGIIAKHYMQKAFDDNADKVFEILQKQVEATITGSGG